MQLTNNFTAEKKSAMIVSVPPGFVEFTTGGNPSEIIRTSQDSFHAPASFFFAMMGNIHSPAKKCRVSTRWCSPVKCLVLVIVG